MIKNRNEKKDGTALSLLAMIVLAAFAMRSPMGCIGPLMVEIREGLGLTGAQGGLLTTLPLLLFSASAPVAVILGDRMEMKRVLPLAFALITFGVVVRSLGSVFFLFAGTVLVGFGTGLLNVALPAFFKEYYPERSGKLMGIYSSSLTAASASTAAFIEPLASGLGDWNLALLAVFLFPLAATALSLPFSRSDSLKIEEKDALKGEKTGLKRKIMVALYMGLQSLVFYTVLTWYPTIISSTRSLRIHKGSLITIMQIASFFPAYLIPVVSTRKNITKLSLLTPLLFIPGMAAAYFIHNSVALVAGTILFGFSIGSTFSMGITLCSVYGKNGHDTASMISFGQCIGYILASFGPTGFGYIYDITLSWNGTIVILMVLSSAMSLTALGIRKE